MAKSVKELLVSNKEGTRTGRDEVDVEEVDPGESGAETCLERRVKGS